MEGLNEFIKKQINRITESKEEKKERLLEEKREIGRKQGAKHMLIIWDSADMEEIYDYANTDEDLEQKKNKWNKSSYTNVSRVESIEEKKENK